MPDGIIADKDVLEEDYIPQNIPCREAQRKELAFCISPAEKGRKPFDCLCHGKPGTGKTALVKYILQQVNENTNALGFYANCWENKTLNLILDRLIEQAHVIVSDVSSSAKISRLKQKIKDKACVVVLDEIDKLDGKDLNDILYILKEIGRIGIICISNTRKYVLSLDPRVTSRLIFNSINFPPYSNEELMTILKQRIFECGALYPNACPKEIIESIVDLAAGDARIAIQTLRNAAYVAEKANRIKITREDVETGYEEVKEIKRKYYLQELPHHKLIYEIVKKNPGITSSDFYEIYKQEVRKQGLSPKSDRTFSNYVNSLIRLGYLKVERVKTKGNVRLFTVLNKAQKLHEEDG